MPTDTELDVTSSNKAPLAWLPLESPRLSMRPRKSTRPPSQVLACFFGHKHRNRWTVYDGTNYITMAATHWKCSFAEITIGDTLDVRGFGGQQPYQLPLPKWATG
jgi:hypothetical protein